MSDDLDKRFPAIAEWIQHGWIEFGEREYPCLPVMALECGNVAYEDAEGKQSLTEYLNTLEHGLRKYMKEHLGEEFE